eukprot:s4193_g8.t1
MSALSGGQEDVLRRLAGPLHRQISGDDADVEKAMLLDGGLAAEAACLAPLKQAMEVHLREYREHLVLELRTALQREVYEATAELKATANELRTLCGKPRWIAF